MTDAPLPQVKGRGWLPVAVAVIMTFEGIVTVGYHDRIDPPGVNTVCYGHIEGVHIGDRYTKIECKEMLIKDIPRYDAMVKKCIHVPLPDYRHAAMVSFTYNVGGGRLCKSSVARKLNAGDVKGGCDALLLYDMANGKVLAGLETRRKAERVMCLSDANNPGASLAATPVVPLAQHVDLLKPEPVPKVVVLPAPASVTVAPAPSRWERFKLWLHGG